MPCAQTHLRFNGRSRTCPGGIANLGELSADALIATYGLQRVAIVSESSLAVAKIRLFGNLCNRGHRRWLLLYCAIWVWVNTYRYHF